jgi:hypothetical protein
MKAGIPAISSLILTTLRRAIRSRAHNLTEKLDTSGSLKDTAALVKARCAMR